MIRFVSRRQRERDLDDEIRVHLEMAIRERVARGEPKDEAEAAAHEEFGDVRRIKEATRAAWGFGLGGVLDALGGATLAFAGGPVLGVSHHEPLTANERLKDSFRSWFWAAMILATVVHVAVFALWPELGAPDLSIDSTAVTVLAMPTVDIPPPPEPIQHPAEPVGATVDVPDDVTIGRTDFSSNPVPVLPPPPARAAGTHDAAGIIFPYTVAPRILNRDEVVRAMQREYPAVLRDAGIHGTVNVFFFVDERGRVKDRRVDISSGVPGLDQAALAVAETFRFSPALNRDQAVSVWVSFPIVFQVR